jgi:polysaccharide export outer membrane protein
MAESRGRTSWDVISQGVTLFSLGSLLLLGFSSCLVSKPVKYFGGNIDTTRAQQYSIPDPVIEKGDILSITIYSDNPDATAIFNQAGTTGVTLTNQGMSEGIKSDGAAKDAQTAYLVDNHGHVRMHAIGELKAEGLTRQQLEELVLSRIKSLGVLMNPYCVVRFSNFKVTVLGEVAKPGTFNVPLEKITILEAMSLAGEVSMAGRRDRMILIRETMGKRSFARIDLSDPNVLNSPYFYLKQNDVLIVEADERKTTPADQQTFQFVSLAFSIVSILVVFATTFIR